MDFLDHFLSLLAEGSLVLLTSGLAGLQDGGEESVVRAPLAWVRPPGSQSRPCSVRLHKPGQAFELPFALVSSTRKVTINLPPRVAVKNSA